MGSILFVLRSVASANLFAGRPGRLSQMGNINYLEPSVETTRRWRALRPTLIEKVEAAFPV